VQLGVSSSAIGNLLECVLRSVLESVLIVKQAGRVLLSAIGSVLESMPGSVLGSILTP
jgi:hypothetical protein